MPLTIGGCCVGRTHKAKSFQSQGLGIDLNRFLATFSLCKSSVVATHDLSIRDPEEFLDEPVGLKNSIPNKFAELNPGNLILTDRLRTFTPGGPVVDTGSLQNAQEWV